MGLEICSMGGEGEGRLLSWIGLFSEKVELMFSKVCLRYLWRMQIVWLNKD
jgi:hypothetical protein